MPKTLKKKEEGSSAMVSSSKEGLNGPWVIPPVAYLGNLFPTTSQPLFCGRLLMVLELAGREQGTLHYPPPPQIEP